eukprot:1218852-Amphidinium_carterae.1
MEVCEDVPSLYMTWAACLSCNPDSVEAPVHLYKQLNDALRTAQLHGQESKGPCGKAQKSPFDCAWNSELSYRCRSARLVDEWLGGLRPSPK